MAEPIVAPPAGQAPATPAASSAPVVDPNATPAAAAAPTPSATPPAGAPAAAVPTPKEGTEPKPDAVPKVPPTGEAKDVTKDDLKLPEGSLLDPKAVDELAAFAKAEKLSKETAQKVLERESALRSSFVEVQQAELVKTQKSWVSDAQKDKEYGGDRFGENAELAKRVFQRYGTEEFGHALEKSGLGNHPELLRFVIRIGKSMAEDQLVMPAADGGGSSRKSAADVLYGSPTPA